MKINGKEIDMKKVVSLHEKECIRIKNQEEVNEKIRAWWNTGPGLIERERRRENILNLGVHRQRIYYLLTDESNEEQIMIEGQDELAAFLDYKSVHSNLRTRIISGTVSNKSKTKIYNIKEILI